MLAFDLGLVNCGDFGDMLPCRDELVSNSNMLSSEIKKRVEILYKVLMTNQRYSESMGRLMSSMRHNEAKYLGIVFGEKPLILAFDENHKALNTHMFLDYDDLVEPLNNLAFLVFGKSVFDNELSTWYSHAILSFSVNKGNSVSLSRLSLTKNDRSVSLIHHFSNRGLVSPSLVRTGGLRSFYTSEKPLTHSIASTMLSEYNSSVPRLEAVRKMRVSIYPNGKGVHKYEDFVVEVSEVAEDSRVKSKGFSKTFVGKVGIPLVDTMLHAIVLQCRSNIDCLTCVVESGSTLALSDYKVIKERYK